MERRRRALSHVGGRARGRGEPEASALLASVLEGVEEVPWDRLTHPFHAYAGRMHPEVARRVLAARPDAARVLDPFMGGGTVVVEALAAGRRVIGRDINPIALLIARTRTAHVTAARRAAWLAAAGEVSAASFAAARRREPVRLSAAARSQAPWYAPHVLLELQGLAHAIDAVADGELREWMRAVLSSLLVKLSSRRGGSTGEPGARQVGRGTASTLFLRRAEELARMWEALEGAVPPGTPAPRLALGDARDLDTIDDASVDLVLTSPPYPGTYDYLAHQARRLPWLKLEGWARRAEGREIGARRHQRQDAAGRWREEQLAWLRAAARVLRPGGEAWVLIGDGVADGRPWLADREIEALAPGAGLVLAAAASQDRPHFHRDAERAFAGAPRREHGLLLRRPSGPPR